MLTLYSDMPVLDQFLYGWVVAALVVYGFVRVLPDNGLPVPRPIEMSIFVGALWPVLILGVAQICFLLLVSAYITDRPALFSERGLPPPHPSP
jgi:hypothetical protein